MRALALVLALAPSLALAQDLSAVHTARAALSLGRLDEAEAALETASRASYAASDEAALARTWADLGDALYHRGAHDGAVRAYARALVLEPSSVSLHVSRGWALDASGHGDAARDEIEAARRLDPGNTDATLLERHMDEQGSVRTGLSIGGGVVIGLGVAIAFSGAIAGAVIRQQRPLTADEATAFDWLVGSGIVLAVSGVVLAVLGELIRVGSNELPRRAGSASVWLDGGGLRGTF